MQACLVAAAMAESEAEPTYYGYNHGYAPVSYAGLGYRSAYGYPSTVGYGVPTYGHGYGYNNGHYSY